MDALSTGRGASDAAIAATLRCRAATISTWKRHPAFIKLTKDQLREFVLPGRPQLGIDFPNKHRVFAFGPDVTLPVASKSKLFAQVNIRYL